MSNSEVDKLFAELIDFIEGMVDPRKVEHDKRWHKEPNISYGFSSSDNVKVYKKFNPHFYDLRKGVGWALKDNMRFDKRRVLDYIRDLRRKGVSSTITLYAIRDLKGKEREEILKMKPQKKRQEN